MELVLKKILSISLYLNFTPNILGCYGLRLGNRWLDSWNRLIADVELEMTLIF